MQCECRLRTEDQFEIALLWHEEVTILRLSVSFKDKHLFGSLAKFCFLRTPETYSPHTHLILDTRLASNLRWTPEYPKV